MATLITARAGLVTFGATVPKPGGGYFASYDLKGFYDLSAPTIPCLLALLDLEEQPGWQTLASLGGGPYTEFTMYHYALWEPVADNPDFTYIEPDILAIIDNYRAALAATPFLTPDSAPSIHSAPHVQWAIKRSTWGVGADPKKEVTYYSVIFRLACRINQ